MKLETMTDEELAAEQARLEAGNVGEGFDKSHLPQCLKMVTDEIKKRNKKQTPKEETKK
jgi:hypothetical protein